MQRLADPTGETVGRSSPTSESRRGLPRLNSTAL
jgi:hypothetical protein